MDYLKKPYVERNFKGFAVHLDHVFKTCKWTKKQRLRRSFCSGWVFEHDTLRWKKQNAFTHQPYHVLQSISDRIRWLRLQRGLTQQEAAALLSVGRSTYFNQILSSFLLLCDTFPFVC